MDHSSISIMIAAINEEAGIGPTLSELNNSFKNSYCLVVDSNSNDKTAFIAQKLGAHVIYQNGQGKGNAISEGLKHINDITKYLVFTDGDFT